MDGSSGSRAQASRAYARNLAPLGLPVLLWDERWSSASAERGDDRLGHEPGQAGREDRQPCGGGDPAGGDRPTAGGGLHLMPIERGRRSSGCGDRTRGRRRRRQPIRGFPGGSSVRACCRLDEQLCWPSAFVVVTCYLVPHYAEKDQRQSAEAFGFPSPPAGFFPRCFRAGPTARRARPGQSRTGLRLERPCQAQAIARVGGWRSSSARSSTKPPAGPSAIWPRGNPPAPGPSTPAIVPRSVSKRYWSSQPKAAAHGVHHVERDRQRVRARPCAWMSRWAR